MNRKQYTKGERLKNRRLELSWLSKYFNPYTTYGFRRARYTIRQMDHLEKQYRKLLKL